MRFSSSVVTSLEITDGVSREVAFKVTPARLILDLNFILQFELMGFDECDIGDANVFLQNDWTILRFRPVSGDPLLDVLWSQAQSRSQHVDDFFEGMASLPLARTRCCRRDDCRQEFGPRDQEFFRAGDERNLLESILVCEFGVSRLDLSNLKVPESGDEDQEELQR